MSMFKAQNLKNAFANVDSSTNSDPYQLIYRPSKTPNGVGLGLGQFFVIRFLSLDASHRVTIPCRRAGVATRDGASIWNVTVPDPGPEHSQNIVDDTGTPMSELPPEHIWWVPVFVWTKNDSDGSVLEEINQVRWIEVKKGVAGSIKKLSQDTVNGTSFDTIPHYDIRLKVVDTPGNSYELDPVLMEVKGNRPVPAENAKPLEEIFSEEQLADLEQQFMAVLDHLKQKVSSESDPKAVARRFKHYRDEAAASVGNRPPTQIGVSGQGKANKSAEQTSGSETPRKSFVFKK